MEKTLSELTEEGQKFLFEKLGLQKEKVGVQKDSDFVMLGKIARLRDDKRIKSLEFGMRRTIPRPDFKDDFYFDYLEGSHHRDYIVKIELKKLLSERSVYESLLKKVGIPRIRGNEGGLNPYFIEDSLELSYFTSKANIILGIRPVLKRGS